MKYHENIISLQAELKLNSENLNNINHKLTSMKHQVDQLIKGNSNSSDNIIIFEETKKEKQKKESMNKLINTSINSMNIEYKWKLSHLNKQLSEIKDHYDHCQKDHDHSIKKYRALSLEKKIKIWN